MASFVAAGEAHDHLIPIRSDAARPKPSIPVAIPRWSPRRFTDAEKEAPEDKSGAQTKEYSQCPK